MVHMEVLRFLFVCLLSLGSTTSFCSYDHQCGIDLKCCYGRCIYDRSSCICIQDYECEEGEQCCNGRCISNSFSCPCWGDSDCVSHKLCCDRKCMKDLASCPCSDDHQCVDGKRCCGGVCLYCGWSDEAYAGAIVGPIIFVAIIISIVSCFCCSCCPLSDIDSYMHDMAQVFPIIFYILEYNKRRVMIRTARFLRNRWFLDDKLQFPPWSNSVKRKTFGNFLIWIAWQVK